MMYSQLLMTIYRMIDWLSEGCKALSRRPYFVFELFSFLLLCQDRNKCKRSTYLRIIILLSEIIGDLSYLHVQ